MQTNIEYKKKNKKLFQTRTNINYDYDLDYFTDDKMWLLLFNQSYLPLMTTKYRTKITKIS